MPHPPAPTTVAVAEATTKARRKRVPDSARMAMIRGSSAPSGGPTRLGTVITLHRALDRRAADAPGEIPPDTVVVHECKVDAISQQPCLPQAGVERAEPDITFDDLVTLLQSQVEYIGG